MKGQYQIINEILIVAIGIILVGVFLFTFTSVENSVTNINEQDQIESISNYIASGIVKAYSIKNSEIRLEIPEKIGKNVYRIFANENLTIFIPGYNYTKELFNIGKNYNISGEVMSSAGYIKIIVNATNILITR
jgi:hypothetical protein